MQVTGPDTVLFIHGLKFTMSEKYGPGMIVGRLKQGSGELIILGLENHFVDAAAAFLAHAYIPAQIFNQYAQGMAGEIPVHHACPEVWIKRDEDYERGKHVIETYENTPVTTGNVQCPTCGEENPANFQLCWKCGGGLETAGNRQS